MSICSQTYRKKVCKKGYTIKRQFRLNIVIFYCQKEQSSLDLNFEVILIEHKKFVSTHLLSISVVFQYPSYAINYKYFMEIDASSP